MVSAVGFASAVIGVFLAIPVSMIAIGKQSPSHYSFFIMLLLETVVNLDQRDLLLISELFGRLVWS